MHCLIIIESKAHEPQVAITTCNLQVICMFCLHLLHRKDSGSSWMLPSAPVQSASIWSHSLRQKAKADMYQHAMQDMLATWQHSTCLLTLSNALPHQQPADMQQTAGEAQRL
jgi:hypothetical protein